MNNSFSQIINSGSVVFTSSIDGKIVKKKASDLSIGDSLLTFIIEGISPTVIGHFEYSDIKIKKDLLIESYSTNLFHKKSEQKLIVPKGYKLFSDGWTDNVESKKKHSTLLFPLFNHDLLQTSFDIPLYNYESDLLDEKKAFLIGATIIRPHFYKYKKETWASFSYNINVSNPSVKKAPKELFIILDNIFNAYLNIIKSCVKNNYLFEKKYNRIGRKDIFLPDKSNFFNPNLKHSNTHSGFSFHFPISKSFELNFSSDLGNDAYIYQFWFSTLYPRMLQESPVSVLKAFLCGLFDTTCNIDKTQETVGIDFKDKYSGSFPVYTGIDQFCGRIFDHYTPDPTRYTRVYKKEGRPRGRLLRVPLNDYLSEIGFISTEKFKRSCEINDSNYIDPFFPTSNILSSALSVPVFTQNDSSYSSNESEIKKADLYVLNKLRKKESFIGIKFDNNNAVPVSELPLGFYNLNSQINLITPKSTKIKYSEDWGSQFFDILNTFTKDENFEIDLLFEYLIALLFSELNGCKEAYAIPRGIDEGIDCGAKYSLNDSDDTFEVVIQAKFQVNNVGRRVIDQLRGAMGSKGRYSGSIGYVVTNSNFSLQSKKSSKKDYPVVKLINGSKLCNMLLSHKIGLIKKKNNILLNISFYQKLVRIVNETRSNKDRIFIRLDNGLPQTIK